MKIIRLCVLFLCFSVVTAQGLTIQNAGVDVNEQGKTVFKLFADEPVSPHIFHLKNPPRIVLDFNTLEWKAPLLSSFTGKGGITALRMGQFKPNVTRLVIETEKPVKNFEVSSTNTRTSQSILQLSFVHPQKTGPVSILGNNLPEKPVEKPPEIIKQPEPVLSQEIKPVQTSVVVTETSTLPAKEAKKQEKKQYVIVIDAGHGGNDPGAVARGGEILEKNVTLDVARLLKTYLEKDTRFKVVLTRNSDVYIPLAGRVMTARTGEADLFISLHADMFPSSTKIRGATVYTLSDTASDKEAAELAQAENKSDLIAGITLPEESFNIAGILLDLAQRETHAYSLKYANHLLDHLKPVSPLTPHPHREAGFKVLKAPDVPSVLIEMGYLSNEQDQHNLLDPAWRRQFARAIATSIRGFFVK